MHTAIVFKQLPASCDFTCSEAITLPGEYARADDAWRAVRAAIEAGGPAFIGGEVRQRGVPFGVPSSSKR